MDLLDTAFCMFLGVVALQRPLKAFLLKLVFRKAMAPVCRVSPGTLFQNKPLQYCKASIFCYFYIFPFQKNMVK